MVFPDLYTGKKISSKFLFFIFLYASLPLALPLSLPFFLLSSFAFLAFQRIFDTLIFIWILKIILIVGCAFSLKDEVQVIFSQITTPLHQFGGLCGPFVKRTCYLYAVLSDIYFLLPCYQLLSLLTALPVTQRNAHF